MSELAAAQVLDSLDTLVGPLAYRWLAHDEWAQRSLAELRRQALLTSFVGDPGRILHCSRFVATDQEIHDLGDGAIPDALARLAPPECPRSGWHWRADDFGVLCGWHDAFVHCFLGQGSAPKSYDVHLHLPWNLMLEDITASGGVIMHTALVSSSDCGWLLTAPPSGGKSTAIERLPRHWHTLGDDAALVWRTGTGHFAASPLPTWGALIGTSETPSRIPQWRPGESVEIGACAVLGKAPSDSLERLPKLVALRHVYRAVTEHPHVCTQRRAYRERLFTFAVDFADQVPCWEVHLTPRADAGPQLEKAFGQL